MSVTNLNPGAMQASSAEKSMPVVGVLIALLLIWGVSFRDSLSTMMSIWSRSETFTHGFVVVPISIYLLWASRRTFITLPVRVAWGVLPALLLAIAMWMIGRQTSVAALEHISVVLVLIFAIWFSLGHDTFKTVAFPAFFLLFMAPFGDFLVPSLMHYTAEFTVSALRASGVPVYQEGLHFVVPNGRWSVVEACSGIRYLIASFMVGTLYAYLNYRSLRKRLVFALVALAVPIVANWFRAYMIVMLGYLTDNTLAAGVDHLIYGWVFFGIVIMAMFWIGNRWRDEDPVTDPLDARPVSRPHVHDRRRAVIGVLVAGSILAGGAAFDAALAPDDVFGEVRLKLPRGSGVWKSQSVLSDGYQPEFSGYRADAMKRYVGPAGDVTLYVAIYANQVSGHEMISWENRLVSLEPGARWRIVAQRDDRLGSVDADYLRVVGSGKTFHVWHWFRIGDQVATGAVKAKALLAWNRLLHGEDASANIVLIVPGEDGDAARDRADAFLSANGGGLDSALSVALESGR